MKFFLLCKRHYTNKDLLIDRFGRLYHLPVQLASHGHAGLVVAADYRRQAEQGLTHGQTRFCSLPFALFWPFGFLWRCARLLREFGPDWVIASGDSHFGALGWLLAKLVGARFAFDVYDFYPAFGSNRLPGMRALFYFAVRRADLLVAASVPIAQRLAPYQKTSVVIENGVDTALFKPMDKTEVRQRLGIVPDGPLLGYFGSEHRAGGLNILIEACERLRGSYPGLRLLLAGKLSGLDIGRDWISYLGLLPQAQLPGLINACDVAVIPYMSAPQIDVSNACKIAEYLACRVSVVVTRVSNHAELFAAAPEALCQPGDSADLARAIAGQLQAPQRVELPPQLTWERLGDKLLAALGEPSDESVRAD